MRPRTLGFHHTIKALILLGFAVYIAYLVKTDGILLYIAPRMTAYVKLSSLALYIVAIYQLYLGIRAFGGRTETDCDCDHDHTPSSSKLKNTLLYGLFVFPLLLGFLLPDTTMGSSLAAKKGMNLNSAASVKKDSAAAQPAAPAPSPGGGQAGGAGSAPAAPPSGNVAAAGSGSSAASSGTAGGTASNSGELFPSDKFTKSYADFAKKLYAMDVIPVKEDLFMETLTSVDLFLDRFVGKKLQLTGFVYRQDEMKPNQFVVARFSIQCCSADASPFGVLAEYDKAQTLASDSWVTVTGTISKAKYEDNDILVLKVEKVVKAEPAKTPYVYPNYDFGS
ncbi:TIGR03943 family protein [Paenibacillus filicis]|uniref:TIGR03943 family protein n=1 Tax=Paenibacillus gyeongsangnamensis TaxID=3388067 RepID=A0ABT4QAJ4_9BACL|nr:TIGR03943 family protein [Paenibacillus filicis]MCZ8513839.1 TIGR03943 family protein [Paenibacillus filicis]